VSGSPIAILRIDFPDDLDAGDVEQAIDDDQAMKVVEPSGEGGDLARRIDDAVSWNRRS
jgi:hypothetical protein